MSATPKNLAAVKDGAKHINVHPKTLRRYIAEGLITGYRVGPRNLRVDLDELDKFARPVRRAENAEPQPTELERRIAKAVAEAPPLTPEQRDRLALLFRSAA